MIYQVKEKYKDIFEKMLISKNTYYHWLHSYNDGGTEALKAIKRVGQKNGNPKYDDKIFKELFEKLDLMDEYWSIPKMQELVLKLHNVQVPYAYIGLLGHPKRKHLDT